MSTALYKYIPPASYTRFAASLESTLLCMGVPSADVNEVMDGLGDEAATIPVRPHGRRVFTNVGGARLELDSMRIVVSPRSDRTYSCAIIGDVVQEVSGV